MKLPAQPFGVIALAAAALLSGCITPRELKPGRTRLSAQLTIVPAKIIGNHFIVECKWDKHGPWRFLVDTGSSVTVVSSEFAHQYATDKAASDAPPVRVHSSTGESILLPAVTVRQIELSDARFENIQALIINLDELSGHLGLKIDGVLGFPLFRDTIFTLDYPQSRLLINPVNETPMLVPGYTVKFNNNRRTPLIPVQVGDNELAALVDSGSDGPLMLNPAGLTLKFSVEPRPGAIVGTLTNDRTQEIGRLAEPFSLGNYTFNQPVVDLTDNLSSVGGEVLREFSVTFDESRNQVTFFRQSTAPIAPAPRRSCGLSFSKTPAYWRIAGIVSGAPADNSGVQPGDLVTRINGEPVSAWSLQRFEELAKRSTEISFTFLDGRLESTKSIPTFDLVP